MAEDEISDGGLGLRAKRYAKVGRAVGGLAARLAGERYLGLSIDRSEHAADLKAALGGLKGPLMKIAQILSTIPSALPKEYAEELAELQANAPAMSWNFVKRRMNAELGLDWQDKFAEFSHEAVAAASLGPPTPDPQPSNLEAIWSGQVRAPTAGGGSFAFLSACAG